MKFMRKRSKLTEAAVPDVATPEVPDVPDPSDAIDNAKDMVEDATPSLPKSMLFKLWLAKTFGCCFGAPEMPQVGAVTDMIDTPTMAIPGK